MLPEVVGHVSLYLHRAQTPEKNNKPALQCARCLTKLKTAGSMLTYANIPSPHWRQRRKSHRDAVEITLKKLASVATIRLRGTVLAANRKTRHNNTVTSRQYGRRAIFVPGDVKFQDGDAFDLSKLGGGRRFLPLLLRSFNVLLALAYFAIRYTHIGLQLCYGTTASATFGYFLCTMQINV